MENKRTSMVFYLSFYESLKNLPIDLKMEIIDAIFVYSFYGIESELSPIASSMFALIKPQIDANMVKYKNGKKGGRPTNKQVSDSEDNNLETEEKPNNNLTETKNNLTETKPYPNVNYNVNYNVNSNENLNGNENGGIDIPKPHHFDTAPNPKVQEVKTKLLEEVTEVIEIFNAVTGKKCLVNKSRTGKINKLLKAGYTKSDFRAVIEMKYRDWSNDEKMSQYLTPDTIFGEEKFTKYIEQVRMPVVKPIVERKMVY